MKRAGACERREWSLSLRILVDADTQDHSLVQLLRDAGHDVLTANEAGLRTAKDPEVFEFARQNNRIILTKNPDDYRTLHDAEPAHPGILGIHQYRLRRKNMTHQQVVRAIANIESQAIDVRSRFLVLNHWKY